uniref:Uncharacterized protein n=1 Tax=viral metagenome TaxID=1070528 RepID=A0A6M3IKV9_9ZZZZ
MRIDFGSVTITNDALRGSANSSRIHIFGQHRQASDEDGIQFEVTEEQKYDLLSVLVESCDLSLEEGEEARVRDIIGQETPD